MEKRGDVDHDQDDEGEGQYQYPTSCGGYYVQSPSTISYANTTTSTYFINPDYSAFSISHTDDPPPNHQLLISTLDHDDDDDDDDQLISNHYLLHHGHHKKTNSYDINDDNQENCLIGRTTAPELVDDNNINKVDDDEYYLHLNGKNRSAGVARLLSFDYSEDSIGWICIQMSWRFILSICVALLVFYLVTKPPPPKVSIEVSGIKEFLLGEGLDASGVSTKLITFNCSINLFVLNKSKLFGLHIQTPSIQISFGPLLLFASSSSSPPHDQHDHNHINLSKSKMYAESSGRTRWKMYVGTKNKPLYGAGRAMDDMLRHSKTGLPLLVTINFSSHFRVVWDLIRPTFHHHARCLLLLHPSYDKKHRTQSFNATCTLS